MVFVAHFGFGHRKWFQTCREIHKLNGLLLDLTTYLVVQFPRLLLFVCFDSTVRIAVGGDLFIPDRRAVIVKYGFY